MVRRLGQEKTAPPQLPEELRVAAGQPDRIASGQFIAGERLVAAEPATLRRVVAMARDPVALRRGGIYSAAAHLLGPNLAERAATLAITARKFGDEDLAVGLEPFGADSPWWPRATRWKSLAPHFVVRTAHGAVRAVAVGMIDGQGVAVSTGDDGEIQVWDIDTLEPQGATIASGAGSGVVPVSALAVCGQHLFAVVRSALVGWDLVVRQPVPLAWPDVAVSSLGKLGDDCVAVLVDGTRIELRRVSDGTALHTRPITASRRPGANVAVGMAAGRPFLVDRADVHDFDEPPMTRHLRASDCNAVGAGVFDGLPAIATGSSNGVIDVWSADRLERRVSPLRGHETYVDAVTFAERAGQSVIVSGSRDGTMRVWMPSRHVGADKERAAHAEAVDSLALGDGIVVSGSWDRTVRVWHDDSLEPVGAPPVLQAEGPIAVGRVGGRPLLFAGGPPGVTRWDLETRARVGAPGSSPVRALAIGSRLGAPAVIGGTDDGHIHVFHGDLYHRPACGERPVERVLRDGARGAHGHPLVREPRLPLLQRTRPARCHPQARRRQGRARYPRRRLALTRHRGCLRGHQRAPGVARRNVGDAGVAPWHPAPGVRPPGASTHVWCRRVAAVRLSRWTNVSATGDFVALERRLATLFGSRVLDLPVDNAYDAHDIGSYLTAREVATAIRGGLIAAPSAT